MTSRLGTGKSLTFFYSVVSLLSIQLYEAVYLPIPVYPAACSSSCLHLASCHVFIAFCSGFTIFELSVWLLSTQLSSVVLLPNYTFFQLSSYYLSSFLQLFAAYLHNFLQLPSCYLSSFLQYMDVLPIYTIFATPQLLYIKLSAVVLLPFYAIFRNSPAVICPAFCSCPAGELPSCPAAQLSSSSCQAGDSHEYLLVNYLLIQVYIWTQLA